MPEIVLEQNSGGYTVPVEQFCFNPNAYIQPYSFKPAAVISSTGALRDQHYVEVMVNPVEFCPGTQHLSIINKIIVTLNFITPKGELQQELGLFSDIAAEVFINFDKNAKRYIFPKNPPQGIVKFINLTDTSQACKILADYLILTDSSFFKPNDPNSQLLRLANHRAKYNGYDVTIVNVEQILELNFDYDGNPDPFGDPDEFIKEQKIRTFIRRVYEGKNANHMTDKHLAFVLLVGDNYEGNTGIRSL